MIGLLEVMVAVAVAVVVATGFSVGGGGSGSGVDATAAAAVLVLSSSWFEFRRFFSRARLSGDAWDVFSLECSGW